MAKDQRRIPINCSDKTIQHDRRRTIAHIGFRASGQPGIFLWCKTHHEAHFCSLVMINQAVADLQDRDIIDEKQESA